MAVDQNNRIWVPEGLLKGMVKRWHLQLGHPGERKILETIKPFWTGPNFCKINKEIVKSCAPCQFNKGRNYAYGNPEGSISSPSFNFLVSSDIVGPYNSREFQDNFETDKFYCITLTDIFSRFTLILIIERIDSRSIQAIFNNWFAKFGVPTRLITDRGAQYISTSFQRFLKENRVEHKPTPAYHP